MRTLANALPLSSAHNAGTEKNLPSQSSVCAILAPSQSAGMGKSQTRIVTAPHARGRRAGMVNSLSSRTTASALAAKLQARLAGTGPLAAGTVSARVSQLCARSTRAQTVSQRETP